ncbi:MAG: efflux transporter outer membrane subunit [Desulfotalea sp.]
MNKIFFFLLVFLILQNLTACSHIEERENETVFKTPAMFTESGQVELSSKWWLDFADPDLNMLIEQALGNNFSLQAAYYRLEQSKAQYAIAGSDLYPKLTGKIDAGSTERENNNTRSTYDDFSLSLNVSYEMDLWGKIASLDEAGRYNYLATDMDLQTAAISLSAQVASTWYQLKDKRNRLEITNRQLGYNQKALEIITLQFKTGKIAIADVIQQRQLIESNFASKVRLEEEIILTEKSLLVLLGSTNENKPIPETTGITVLPPLPKTGLPIDMITNRPDVRSAFLQLRATDANLAAAIANRYPTLSLTVSAQTSSENISDLFDNWLANIAAGLVAPILDGGARQNEVVRQKAKVQEKLSTYNQVALEAITEVESTLTKETKQIHYISYIDQQLQYAKQATNQIKYRYLNGTENYQRVISSIISKQKLEQEQFSSRLRLIENRIKLCQALASGWEFRGNKESEPEVKNAN